MPGISTLLKAIMKMEDGSSIKKQGLDNYLKKEGVSNDEKHYTNMYLPPGERVNQADLLDAYSDRSHVYGQLDLPESTTGADFKHVLPDVHKNDKNYQERHITFKNNQGEDRLIKGITLEEKQQFQELLNMTHGDNIEPGTQENVNLMERAGELGWDGQTSIDDWAWAQSNRPLDIAQEETSRYTSGHFPDIPNHLSSSRTTDANVGGVDSRVLHEAQSDLHQQGRMYGYDKDPEMPENKISELLKNLPRLEYDHRKLIEKRNELLNDRSTSAQDISNVRNEDRALINKFRNKYAQGHPLRRYDIENMLDPIHGQASNSRSRNIIENIPYDTNRPPRSPNENNWLEKQVMLNLDGTSKDGLNRLVMPLKSTDPIIDSLSGLHRESGVPQWYDRDVRRKLEKIANKNNLKYSEFDENGINYGAIDIDGKKIPDWSLYSASPIGMLLNDRQKVETDSEAQNIERNPIGGAIADFLMQERDRSNRVQVPYIGGIGDLMLGQFPEFVNDMAYGEKPYSGKGQTMQLDNRMMDII